MQTKNLSKLIEDAIHDKESTIEKLIPITAKKLPCYFGLLKGKIKIADDFDVPLPTNAALQEYSELVDVI